jgi:very-short-patch-repair endonuclease
VVTAQHALERGIEAEFQLEDSELASQRLPDPAERGRVLLTESAEGGAGVLRRLVDEPDALARAARRALDLAHFDPDTGADLLAGAEGDARCEKACYECLLSYSNQIDHPNIDRHAARDLLLALAHSTVARGGDGRSQAEQARDLADRSDTDLERDFLDYLRGHDHHLPTAAQELVESAAARPDFTYRSGGGAVAVFLDGPVHENTHIAERDAAAESRLEDLGWSVIRMRHDEDWAAKVARYPDVFGAGR